MSPYDHMMISLGHNELTEMVWVLYNSITVETMDNYGFSAVHHSGGNSWFQPH